MTGYEEKIGTHPADDLTPLDVLGCMNEAHEALRKDFADLLRGFDRLAGHLGPLLTKQYHDSQARMRMLETRIRNRQERPLITQMANLLAEVRRLDSAEDVKAHVEQAMLQALNGVGYREMGSPGERFDPSWHEPLSGSVGKSGIVTRVHRHGLECYGEVIIKAMVDVEPAPTAEDAEFAAPGDAGPAAAAQEFEIDPVTETEQGGPSA